MKIPNFIFYFISAIISVFIYFHLIMLSASSFISQETGCEQRVLRFQEGSNAFIKQPARVPVLFPFISSKKVHNLVKDC